METAENTGSQWQLHNALNRAIVDHEADHITRHAQIRIVRVTWLWQPLLVPKALFGDSRSPPSATNKRPSSNGLISWVRGAVPAGAVDLGHIGEAGWCCGLLSGQEA